MKNAGAILAAATRRAGPTARKKNPSLNKVKGAPSPLKAIAKSLGSKPPPVAPGPGPKPSPGGMVREGINYKDVDSGLQAQMARQAGLTPSAPAPPPGVVPPGEAQLAEEANESAAQEKQEGAAGEAQEVPDGHTAVKAHTRKLPTSRKFAEKQRRRGLAAK